MSTFTVEKKHLINGTFPLSIIPQGTNNIIIAYNASADLLSLPDDLKVAGSLNLFGCTSITSLPAGLKVRGLLCLVGCTSLTSLPAGLKVGGNLYLPGCTSITSLPAGF